MHAQPRSQGGSGETLKTRLVHSLTRYVTTETKMSKNPFQQVEKHGKVQSSSSVYQDLNKFDCSTECPKNCSSCENGVCKECEPGFFSVQTRLIQRTICVPCGLRMKRAWPDVYFKECAEKGNLCNCKVMHVF